MQRAFILADETLEIEVGQPTSGPEADAPGSRVQFAIGTPLAEVERETIFATLRHCGGNKRRCAELLGVSLKTLYNRLTDYQAAGELPLAG